MTESWWVQTQQLFFFTKPDVLICSIVVESTHIDQEVIGSDPTGLFFSLFLATSQTAHITATDGAARIFPNSYAAA